MSGVKNCFILLKQILFLLPFPLFPYQKVYMRTVRQLKRFDSIRRSPIYVNFDETLMGVSCVRAFRKQQQFIVKNEQLTDESQVAWYLIIIAMRRVLE